MGRIHPRMARESRTLVAMIKIYCRAHHGTKGELCPGCEEFAAYARERLDKCPFQQDKSTCANCTVHCYRSEMRLKAKEIMRFAGPRMAYRYPVLALHHLLDGRREAPDLKEYRKQKAK